MAWRRGAWRPVVAAALRADWIPAYAGMTVRIVRGFLEGGGR